MTQTGWFVAGCMLLTAACSPPGASPLPAATQDLVSSSPAIPSPSPTLTGSPTPSASPPLTAEAPAVQQFTLDETVEFDDGLIIEIAGSVADKAKKTQQGAAATNGQIVIASVRIENGTGHTYGAVPVRITATYGNGTAAKLMIDKTDELQRGFAGNVEPKDESIATLGFAVPHSQLNHVTFIIDPNDDEHDPVSFTGRVRRL